MSKVSHRMVTRLYNPSVRLVWQEARVWRLPTYQRGLVWRPEQALAFVRSVDEGYPIGSLLVWYHDNKQWLLDGQQRVAALTGMRCGTDSPAHQVGWSMMAGEWTLGPQGAEDVWIKLRWWQEIEEYDRVIRLTELRAEFGDERWSSMVLAFDRLGSAVVPLHVLERATPAQAAEAFRRLNIGGAPIGESELAQLMQASEIL